jgi:Flp pilus assembly pilin Flp
MRAKIDERHAARAVQEVPVTRLRITSREEGQTMAEYAVVLGIITPILVLALAALSEAVRGRLEFVAGLVT